MTWSSKQRLSQEELIYLRRDLLALFMNLLKWHSSHMGITNTFDNTTLDIIWKNIENVILINQEND